MRAQRYQLWAALVLLAASGAMLHFRIHPPGAELDVLLPNLFSWLALVVVSLLFLFRSTALLGLLLNSFLAYVGIITMADFSISATLAGTINVMPGQHFFSWLLLTTFPDITILVADFLVGLALYRAIVMEK